MPNGVLLTEDRRIDIALEIGRVISRKRATPPIQESDLFSRANMSAWKCARVWDGRMKFERFARLYIERDVIDEVRSLRGRRVRRFIPVSDLALTHMSDYRTSKNFFSTSPAALQKLDYQVFIDFILSCPYLTKRDHKLLYLYCWKQLSIKEIQKSLNISAGRVYQLIVNTFDLLHRWAEGTMDDADAAYFKKRLIKTKREVPFTSSCYNSSQGAFDAKAH